MLPLLASLLLTSSALASGYIPYRGDNPYDIYLHSTSTESSYPIDNNDDFGVKPYKPNGNIYFSFEQIRRDQTSDIDVREEDVGRYMYRPKITTTPAPTLAKSHKPIIIPDVPPVKYNHHWVEPSPTPMAPPPPPPSPKWEGFDLDFRHSPYSQQERLFRVHEYVVKPQQHPEAIIAPVTQLTEPTQEPARYRIQPTGDSRITEGTTTTVQPHWTEIAASTESYVQQPRGPMHRGASSRRNQGRGSHRFDWHEPVGPAEGTHPVQPEAARAPIPPEQTIPALRLPAVRTPPPVPTLTAWEGDSF